MAKIKVKEIFEVTKEREGFFEEDETIRTADEELERWLNEHINSIEIIAITECDSRWVSHHYTIIYKRCKNGRN